MYKKKEAVLEAMAKIPALDALDIPVEEIPSDEEFSRMSDDVLAALDIDLEMMSLEVDAALVIDDGSPSRTFPAPGPICTPSITSAKKVKSVTIRIPGWVLDAFRAEALKRSVGYQTLIVRVLKASVAGGIKAV